MNRENLNHEEYAKLASGFYPSRFNAEEWVKAVKASGGEIHLLHHAPPRGILHVGDPPVGL